MNPLYYELHISVVAKGWQAPLRRICKELGLKCSSIVGQEPDTILTARAHILNIAEQIRDKAVIALTRADVRITRIKIEAAIVDNKYGQ